MRGIGDLNSWNRVDLASLSTIAGSIHIPDLCNFMPKHQFYAFSTEKSRKVLGSGVELGKLDDFLCPPGFPQHPEGCPSEELLSESSLDQGQEIDGGRGFDCGEELSDEMVSLQELVPRS